ncbi:MAG: glycosyltransferase family 1 protein [Patescibacteria group bacterium]
MLIGIDASQAAKEKKTGVENFAFELIYHLLILDKKNNYILYSDAPIQFPQKFKNAKFIISSQARFWHNLKLPRLIQATNPDVFISPGYMLPLVNGVKMIPVIHDFGSKFFPKAYSQKDRFLQKLSLGRAAAKANAIIFISQQTMNDFKHFYPKYNQIMGVIHLGYDKNQFKQSSNYRPTKQSYILSVGRLEERKNTRNLVAAYGILRKDHPEITHKLVIAGKRGFRFGEIDREIRALGNLSKDVIIPGFIQEKDLPGLYINADVFVYPSLYEGFGIPILESFAAQTPIACSNASSIPEAAGDAAVFFNPHKQNEIADAIYKLISDKKLGQKLVQKGSERLKEFSWERTAQETLKIINLTYNGK